MKAATGAIALVVSVLMVAGPARADLIGLPVKWSQTPWDPENAMYSDHTDPTYGYQVAAEDFACTSRERVAAVRWWGAYGQETEVRNEEWVVFDISFHLSIGDHPNSVPLDGPPAVLYERVVAQQEHVGWNDWANGPVYRYDAYLPGEGFDQAFWSNLSPNHGELFIDICQPGGQGWVWMFFDYGSADPVLDWAAYCKGGHEGPWYSTGSYQLAFELMSPEPATLGLMAAGLAGLALRRRRKALGVLALLVGVCLVLGAAPVAMADWDEGDEALFVQLPDLSTTGVDINVTNDWVVPPSDGAGYYVADDFAVSKGGRLLDLHLWCSWKDDRLPDMNWWHYDPQHFPPIYSAAYCAFELTIYADIPAHENPDGYSKPGEALWSRTFDGDMDPSDDPGWFTARLYEDEIEEGFMNPVTPYNYLFPGDTECYQYNFEILPEEAFVAETGKVYWLGVAAEPLEPGPQIGWKTSSAHWTDYAVGSATWVFDWEVIQRQGRQYDMAFVVTPEPATLALVGLGVASLLLRRRRKAATALALLLGLGFVLAAGTARADDLAPPPWRGGEPRATVQAWEFYGGEHDLPPDGYWHNPYGTPLATITGGTWLNVYEGREGVWCFLEDGLLEVFIPNAPEPLPKKDMWVQVTWMAPDGGGWQHDLYQWLIEPNPPDETFSLTGQIYIDEVVVDTRCYPEPATLALVGLGLAGLALRRRT